MGLFSTYGYARGNPPTKVDPWGLIAADQPGDVEAVVVFSALPQGFG